LINNSLTIDNNKPIHYLYIKDHAELSRTPKILSGAKIIGIDVESDSMFHYKEKVCLIQISAPDVNILIDALSIKNLSPLLPVFSDPNICKVFHGADYDIRSLYRDFGVEINSLFDTQIAAKFLGMMQTGLSSCLESKFGVAMEKKYQKKDWSIRPLPKEMLQYAVKDTYYLISLARTFKKELKTKERLSWVEEECELLSRVRPSPPRPEPLFQRFKGASRLAPRSLAVLEGILKWREDRAMKKDVPPFKILGNHQILELVDKKPIKKEDLECLSPKQIDRLAKSLLDTIQVALAIPDEKLPVFPKEKKQRQSSNVLKKIDALKKWREKYGEKSGLDPSILCPNSLIQSISLMNFCTIQELDRLVEMRNWQKEIFGKEVCTLLTSLSLQEN
jgi:ribonuclease D